MISDRVRTVVLGVVTAVWAMNFFAGLVIEDYKPDQAINGIFMAIAGTLFALGNRNNDGGSNGPNRDQPPHPKPPDTPPQGGDGS